AALQVDKVVGVANGANALGDLLALPAEALMLLASGFHFLPTLLQTWKHLWGASWTALCRLGVGVSKGLMHSLGRLFSLGDRLGGSALFDGQGGCNGLAQLMLDMEEVRRMMRPKVLFHIGEKARRLITGRLDDLTVEARQGLLHQALPGVVIASLARLLQENIVTHRLDSPRHR